jgi:DNA-binding transcriptional MerR regulator
MYSSGEAARLLGISRDSLLSALRSGAPAPKSARIAGRRVFDDEDVERIRAWLGTRRYCVREGNPHA